MLDKIAELRSMASRRGAEILIEVDGGIYEDNASKIIEAGADILVAGSAIYNSPSPETVIQN